MSAEQYSEEVIFKAAIKMRPSAERTAYVKQACGCDANLLTRLETLLGAHDDAGDFLETGPFGSAVELDISPVAEGPGTVIGRYKLLEKIGEGGMAVVYMAEQQEPIRRKVALKIIKLGMDTRQVIARFDAERQALALMDHPSIAKVFDAGATETGRPYFVMELVTGVSITEYCDKNNLSTKDRLALFLQVCHAVQHAHQKGIIHRDLKPSNVMVTHHNGQPIPKVIDFGIAKATNQKLTEKTLFTRYAHLIGTPAYMSPEQAELSDLDVDTRTDIYSLGVLLYELLTGTTPFSEEELRKAGYTEMQRVIREQEPAKPSTRLTTLGETLIEIAKHRGSTPDVLAKAIRGDLDWIVMKSLEKDRFRRYEAADDLALDIQRHLEHRPVLAHAPSTAYRLHKFLRRHRAQVIVALSMSLLGGALIVVFSLWSHSRREFAEAETLRHRSILFQAQKHSAADDPTAALETLEPILDSKYVGVEARLLSDRIQKDVDERLSYYARKIEAQDANAYWERARYYIDYLHDRGKAHADMRQWSAIMSRRALADSRFGTLRDFRRVINMPFDCRIVFSAERPVNEIPMMSVAFGQKGRWQMKLFEIPMFIASLFGLGFLSGLETPAYADFTFGEPEKVSGLRYNEWIDCISYDGLEMYTQGPGGPAGDRSLFDLWVRKRASQDEDWGPVENLGPLINSLDDAEFAASISSDGLTLYFISDQPGGYGPCDIYATTRATRNDPWGPAVNLGPTINSSSNERTMWISADNLELYFGSNRPGGYGGSDIYVARRVRTNDPWGAPVNLGPVVNTPYAESNVSLSPDGLLLFFSEWYGTTNIRPGGHGAPDIWMTRRASIDAPWQTPVNLMPPVNGPTNDVYPWISADGHTLHFRSLDRVVNYQAPILPIVDFNGDGTVDAADMAMLAANWGKSQPLCDIGPFSWGDGIVDEQDLRVLMESLVTPGPHALDVPRDVILSWISPSFAKAHDVYLGTSFADVNGADRANPRDVLVSKAQTATTYDPEGLLAYSQTYYWRVDFVIPGPTPTIYKGPVLDFSTAAFAYPIKSITATASSAQPGSGPEKTVDGSGLDKNDGHSTNAKDMWWSLAASPHWIQYEFDKIYTLHELWVWNANQVVEPALGFGAKSVKIDYSTDGRVWTPLTGLPEFARAPGQPGYAANTIVSFSRVSAKYVKLTIDKNWGVTPQTGLSEVRFFYVPATSATKP